MIVYLVTVAHTNSGYQISTLMNISTEGVYDSEFIIIIIAFYNNENILKCHERPLSMNLF